FLTVIFLRNTRRPHGIATNIVGTWLGVLARIFGVRIKISGTPLPEKTLFISNHISWLDILILGKLIPIHFLSKHEVKTMPIVGWLATRAGTLYITRGSKTSASDACREITAALQQRHNSLVFAEGTTTDGHIKKFHSRTLQSAIDAEAMVQPVALFYPVTNPETGRIEINPVTLFLGDTTIGESFDLITRSSQIDVEVHFLKPISSAGQTRDAIAQHAYDEVIEAIGKIKTENMLAAKDDF
ncbi:MAG TPA: 1-acyl-sn-glycerol-3-phosphate acyltransferase, partial [Gammaproteobacteria bacterium]|nr:1-acyl-sn-glycerol-3-phosphate acyltransferase [Gammaproteobacteria bacterium]